MTHFPTLMMKTYLMTLVALLQGVSPESTCSTPILRLPQLLGKRNLLLCIPGNKTEYVVDILNIDGMTDLLTVMYALHTGLCCLTSAFLQAGVQYHTLGEGCEG